MTHRVYLGEVTELRPPQLPERRRGPLFTRSASLLLGFYDLQLLVGPKGTAAFVAHSGGSVLLENLGGKEESLPAWWIMHSLPSQWEASVPGAEFGIFLGDQKGEYVHASSGLTTCQ